MITRGRLRQLCKDWPLQSNALIYTGYAIVATFTIQTMEQWKDQPMNARKREGQQSSKEERPMEIARWKWSFKFRDGNDPNLTPIKDPSEPYYNLAISAHSYSQPDEQRQKSPTVQCQSADESLLRCDVATGETPITRIHECTFNIDLARVAGMILFSGCFAGPTCALLYPTYHRVFGATSAGVNRSVLFDQTIYMPLVSIPACWYLNGFMKKWVMRDPRLDESKDDLCVEDQQSLYSIEDCIVETTNEMKERYASNLLMTMAIWIPAESINLRFTPVHLRSVVAGAVGLLWTTGMAAWTHMGSQGLLESSVESSMESSMESRVAVKALLSRITGIHNV